MFRLSLLFFVGDDVTEQIVEPLKFSAAATPPPVRPNLSVHPFQFSYPTPSTTFHSTDTAQGTSNTRVTGGEAIASTITANYVFWSPGTKAFSLDFANLPLTDTELIALTTVNFTVTPITVIA